MISNRQDLEHSQAIITELLRSIIQQVEIPMEIAKLEGDAVFMYLARSFDDSSWSLTKEQIAEKLLNFFEVFQTKLSALAESITCSCGACRNMQRLTLKIIAHSGEALFYKIGNFLELSGIDVILVHRLLKNSITGGHYILLTEQAENDIVLRGQMKLIPGLEHIKEFGAIKTFVFFPAS
ncbi:DUF2652 domain-containing protein [bacterium]|nr:DUF2652 domain-containing protein [bacterium]